MKCRYIYHDGSTCKLKNVRLFGDEANPVILCLKHFRSMKVRNVLWCDGKRDDVEMMESSGKTEVEK